MILASALTAVACQREIPGEDELPTVFGTVSVNLGIEDPEISVEGTDQGETKSLISVDTEDFVDAYLFCFNASTKKIEKYDNGEPVAIYTTSKAFDWALPINKKIDIWVVANPGTGNAWKTTLQNALSNASLTESDLTGEKLMFICASSSALKALETSGAHLPMSGVVNGTTLTSPTQSLSIKVKRLFAKYNIYFDMSVLEAEGYTVKSTYLASSKSNTEVPFFCFTGSELGGYKQTVNSKLATIDRNSEGDLQILENGQKVTLYFLENCQGTITGASSWSSVYEDLGGTKLQNCSYMEVGVNISRPSSSNHEAVDKSYAYRIYLGESDMKSNFNVKRNLFKTIKLKLPKPDGVTIKDGFEFTNTNSLSLAPGETITVPFETSVANRNEISFKVSQNGVVNTSDFSNISLESLKANTTKKTAFAYEGTVTLTAKSTANEGIYNLFGGNEKFSDTQDLCVSDPIVLTASTPTPRIQLQRFNVTVNIPKTALVKILNMTAPGQDFSSGQAAFTVSALNIIKNNLGIESSQSSAPAYFEGVKLMGVTAMPQPLNNPSVLRVTFELLNTESKPSISSRKHLIDIVNKKTGQTYVKDVDVTSVSLMATPVTSASYTSAGENGATGRTKSIYGSDIYDIPINGEKRAVYFTLTAKVNNIIQKAKILKSDFSSYAMNMISITGHDLHLPDLNGDFMDLDYNGTDIEPHYDGNSDNSLLDYCTYEYALCSYQGINLENDDYCWEKIYAVSLTHGNNINYTQGLSDFIFSLINPRADWYMSYDDYLQGEQQAWYSVDNIYSVTLDGYGQYESLNFGQNRKVKYPYWSDYLPVILTTLDGKTSDARFVSDDLHADDVVGFMVYEKPLDNYGRVVIGYEFQNINTGERQVAHWAYVDVYREFTIKAGFQFKQVDFYPVGARNHPIGEGSLSRFIPYLRCPEITDSSHSMSYLFMPIIACTALNQQGVNVINPSENFYIATDNAEKWWRTQRPMPHGSQLWRDYGEPNICILDRKALEQNRVVRYSSPKVFDKCISWYELDYAGPRVSSKANIAGLGTCYHADMCYSWRNVMYWNKPEYCFKDNYSFTVDGLTQTVKVNSDGSCNVGKYTRVYFDWMRQPRESLTKINQYDTRFAIYSSEGLVSAYTDKHIGTMYSDTATQTPSIITGTNFFKVHEPYYYSQVSWTFLFLVDDIRVGSASGYFPEELDSHEMNHAYGGTCSFVFNETPFN